jgi:hypothetical protein
MTPTSRNDRGYTETQTCIRVRLHLMDLPGPTPGLRRSGRNGDAPAPALGEVDLIINVVDASLLGTAWN